MTFRIDFEVKTINETNKTDLIDVLESQRGRKCLYYDYNLEGYFEDPLLVDGLCSSSKLLKEHSVNHYVAIKSNHISPNVDSEIESSDCVIYIVRPDILTMQIVAQYVQIYKSKGNN